MRSDDDGFRAVVAGALVTGEEPRGRGRAAPRP
jgi:hypothetical protein